MYDALDLDFNNDGVIDASDLVAITDVLESETPAVTCVVNGLRCDSPDFNLDGDANSDDLAAFSSAIAGTLGGTTTYSVHSRDIAEYRFLYRGYWYDQHLGIYHVRHRAYDPRIQRWLQPDPAMFVDGLNRYAYCGNKPFSMYDPMGLDSYAVGSVLRRIGLDGAGDAVDDLADGYHELIDSIAGLRDAQDEAHGIAIADMIASQARHAQDERRFTVYVHLQMSGVHAVSEVRAVEDVLIGETAVDVAVTAVTTVIPIGPIARGIGGLVSKGLTKALSNRLGWTVAAIASTWVASARMGIETALGRGVKEAAAQLFYSRVGNVIADRVIAQVTINKLKGDALRNTIVAALRNSGAKAEPEVWKWTPFGWRHVDIEVSRGGRVLGGLEVKLNGSRYHLEQRVKDQWLRENGYSMQLIRVREGCD